MPLRPSDAPLHTSYRSAHIVFRDPFRSRGRAPQPVPHAAEAWPSWREALSPRSHSHGPMSTAGAMLVSPRPPLPVPPSAVRPEDLALHLSLVHWLRQGPSDADRVLEACHEGDAGALEALLRARAPTSARYHDGQTPLMLAVSTQQMPCVELLLRFGADANATDEAGTTALHLAAALGDLVMLRRLCAVPRIDLHAKLRTCEGYTPEDVAHFAQMPAAAAFLADCARPSPRD